jgi:hypothetical protein
VTESGPAEFRQRLRVIEIAVLASDPQMASLCQRLAAALTTGGDGPMPLTTTMIVYGEADLPRLLREELLSDLRFTSPEPLTTGPADRASAGAVRSGNGTVPTR